MSTHHRQWLHKCRNILIGLETKNIRQRALSWTEIVNAETAKINAALGINLSNYIHSNNTNEECSNGLLFKYSVDSPLKYLTFLSEWNGIKTRNIASQPTNYNEFEQKAKNWLNGRRAPNYGNTLFPEMIKASFNYSNKLSLLIFGNIPMNPLSNTPHGDSLQNLYHKVLLFAYLTKLCSERIAVHQSWKKTNLLCENSVKNIHSNTAKLLQQYAIHDYTKNDLNSFPGNLQRSAAFFEEQHGQYLARLVRAYQTLQKSTNHQLQSASASASASAVKYVAINSSEYATIMERLTALEQRHNDQANQISSLTQKCHLLQSHIDGKHNTIACASTQYSSYSSSGATVNRYDKLSTNEMNHEYYNNHVYNNMECDVHIHPSLSHKSKSSPSVPMPFAAHAHAHAHAPLSLPPQIDLPSFTSSHNNENNMERKLNQNQNVANVAYGTSNSMPLNMNNDENYSTYNYDDYGLSLQSDHKVAQSNNDDYVSSFTPASNSFIADHIMLDHPNSTPTNYELFAYPTLEY